MSDIDCYCDYDPATAYHREDHIARIRHVCTECNGPILPHEPYERVRAIWEGDPAVCKTCIRCLALREFVKQNVKCFCWAHHHMIEDALETADHYGRQARGSGLIFGALRKYVLIQKHRDAHRSPTSTRTPTTERP